MGTRSASIAKVEYNETTSEENCSFLPEPNTDACAPFWGDIKEFPVILISLDGFRPEVCKDNIISIELKQALL